MAVPKTDTFHLEIVTPEKIFFSDEVDIVIVRTPGGEVGILKNHLPMVMAISIGPAKIKQNDKWFEAIITEGFMEVTQERVVIMVDAAEWPNEIDLNRAKKAKEEAEERMQRKLSAAENARARAAFARAMARLKAGGGYSKQ